MTEAENSTGIIEDILRSSVKASEALQAADKGRKTSVSSKTIEENTIDKFKTLENSDREARRNSDKNSGPLDVEEKFQSFAKESQDLQTNDEPHKNLNIPPSSSGTAKESQKTYIKLSEVFGSVEKSCNSFDKLLKTALLAKEPHGSAGQKRNSLGMIQGFPASVEKQNGYPCSSDVMTCDLNFPTDQARSKTTSQERPTSAPAPRQIPPSQRRAHSLSTVQNQVTAMMQGFMNFVPREYRSELWIYAAGYVFLYTIFKLFTTSTFGFICLMMYVALVTLLVLRFFEMGPLTRRTPR